MRKQQGVKTKYPGVTKTGEQTFRVRRKVVDPETGRRTEVDRIVKGVTAKQAADKLAELVAEARASNVDRMRVSDFARSWLESKSATVSRGTANKYADALEQHIVPGLGRIYCDALKPFDVQEWVNKCLAKGYSVRTVQSWYGCLRTMMIDAQYQLDLPRNPVARVTFPEPAEFEGQNAINEEQLERLLEVFRAEEPDHYGLVAVLAYTGLRFTHASALRWEDVDFQTGILEVKRSQLHGVIGPVSRKKRAPRKIPLSPELEEVLKWQRRYLMQKQARGLAEGWMFPTIRGTLRSSACLTKPWRHCCQEAGIESHFTPHGLRRTFNDLARRAGVDPIVTKALTGHVTERMREHYSSVRLDEKKQALANVVSLIHRRKGGNQVGTV